MLPYLVTARQHLPDKAAPFLCKADLQRINTGFGIAWYHKAKQAKLNKIDRYAYLKTSLDYFLPAAAGNPHDIMAARGIAQTTAELEFLFPELLPGKQNPYNAIPLYKKSLDLEPNGLITNYSAAEYYQKKGLKKVLNNQVEKAAKIFPSITRLKNQPFYVDANKEAVKKGFKLAVKENIMPKAANLSLSALANKEKDFLLAAQYYKAALNFQDGISTKNYLALGNLLIKAKEKPEANQKLLTGLTQSKQFSKDLNRIYYNYKAQNDLAGFIEFSTFAKNNGFHSEQLEISAAKAQIELGLKDSAKQTLNQLKKKSSDNPLIFYLLAQIARKEKDWDNMELSIQRATVLDPTNSKYLGLLADALIYQRKYASARPYLLKAIQHDPENLKYKNKLQKVQSYIN